MKTTTKICLAILALLVVGSLVFTRASDSSNVGGAAETNRFVTCNTANVSVTTGSTNVLAARNNRKYVYLENLSVITTSTVDVFFGTTATNVKGFRLDEGETYEILPNKLWVGAIDAIADATTNVRYVECY